MIKIKILKTSKIDKITIEGHSGYSEYGSDIVCSSVSSIATTSINGILKYDDKSLKYEKKDGFLEIEILKHDHVIDLLIDNMIELLTELKNDYKEYIKII